MKKINLYVRTITGLKALQVMYRLWYMIRSKFGLINVLQIVGHNESSWKPDRFKAPFVCYKHWKRLDIEKHTFCFLNEKVCFNSTVTWKDIIEKSKSWMQFADEDLRHALQLSSGCPHRLIAYHAQQCAEKYIKAFLVFNEIDFPYTHNLRKLLQLCGKDHLSVLEELEII